jgi:multicomponent Na+:H+ antiporter subunit E
MRFYLPRIVLFAVVWAALKGAFTPLNLVAGVIFGGGVLLFVRALYDDVGPEEATARNVVGFFKRLFWMGELILYFGYELLLSSVEVAQTVLRPNMNLNPGIVSLPLDCTTGLEITMLANLISLTPGTLSLEVSPDEDKLYIHAMFIGTEEARTRDHIKHTLERRVIRALGPYEGAGERERGGAGEKTER